MNILLLRLGVFPSLSFPIFAPQFTLAALEHFAGLSLAVLL
jgi:hypothetical protein